MSENLKLKRPASHRWVIGISAFMTIGLVVLLINIITGRAGAFRQYWPVLAVFSCFALALCSLLFGGRKKWAYYVTSTFLAFWAYRGVYTSLVYITYLVTRTSPPKTPYFHVLEANQPFVVQQRVSGVQQMAMPVAAALLVWLFIRFTAGRPSRSYYQFGDAERGEGQKELQRQATIVDNQKVG